jgi:hypothetical protein
MRKLLTFLISTILFLALIPTSVMAQERIKNFVVDMRVNTDGSVDITETITYDFGTQQRHGIYREIPLIKENEEKKKFIMKVTDFSVTDAEGAVREFQNESKRDTLSLKIGDPDRKISGEQVYVISYTVEGALTYFDNFDEFYWDVTGLDWEVPIENVFVGVRLPETVSIENIDFACYTGTYGDNSGKCTGTVQTENFVSIRTTDTLNPNENISVGVGFPKGNVAVLEPAPYRRAWVDYLIWGTIAIFALLGNVVLPIRKILQLLKERKNRKSKEQIVSAWFDPPKKKNGESFSPAETTAILGNRVNEKPLSGEIVYLAQQGYIKISGENKKNLTLKLLANKASIDGLTKEQQKLLDAIFSSENEILIKDLSRKSSLATKFPGIVKSIFEELKSQGMYEKSPDKLSQKNALVAFFSMFIGGVVNFIVYSIAAAKEKRLTDAGIKAYSEAKSLKNFLSSQKETLEFQAEEQLFFERLLPYAVAFGVEEIWIKRFGNVELTSPDWYDGNLNAMQLGMLGSSISRATRSSVSSGSGTSSSGFSSGSSGGGFSGGGGGGGGGGSW